MDDLDAVHRLLDVDLAAEESGATGVAARVEREHWLRWTILGYEALARLHQPPYGDRAIILKHTAQVIGACGFVPLLDAFGQVPAFRGSSVNEPAGLTSAELGLYWAVSPAHQRQGYATEAARALVDYAFEHLRLERVVATTTYDNAASIAVMRKLGMRIERNPNPSPPWLQVVGILYHPRLA
jgi:RimJ/RimL family protein N-acetyltransferase